MVRTIQFIAALVILIAIEVLRVYFIMPFPGSQTSSTLDIAYFLNNNAEYFRWIGWLMLIYPVFYFLIYGKTLAKIITVMAVVLYVVVFYLFNFRFAADHMFYQPQTKTLARGDSNVVPAENLVLGIVHGGEARAYPIEFIGYHHQVRDTLGGEPVMITYCTVCRTGRVYSPVVEGAVDEFRLVGMDHFNAMFEDSRTQSWWRQVNGEAVAGPMKGQALREIPSEQMKLGAWLARHPQSTVLQPDSTFAEKYEAMSEFDEGTIDSKLVGRDSLSWQEKSWIVGIDVKQSARAYDWNDLVSKRIINDTLAGVPVVIALDQDTASFHVWQRDSLTFAIDTASGNLIDHQTSSQWSSSGRAVEGPLKDQQLPWVQAYQEFWHSWKTFRPHTSRYGIK